MKKVLVTGANGFVGGHLVTELLGNNIEVVGVGGPTSQPAERFPSIEYFEIDLMNDKDVRKLNFNKVDAVIHLAGLANVGASFDQPLDYITTNIGIEVKLLETAMAQGAAPKFLIISTGNLYSPYASLPQTEKSPILPSSPYAFSKLGQEELTHYYHMRGFDFIIARPYNHIGPGQGLGFLLPDLAKQVVDTENGISNKIKVGNLDVERDYTDVRDIVKAYRLLLDKGVSGEIYNVCSGVARSGHSMLNSLLKIANTSPAIVKDRTKFRPSDTPRLFGSYKKLKKLTGWEPVIPIETTMSDVLDEWRQKK